MDGEVDGEVLKLIMSWQEVSLQVAALLREGGAYVMTEALTDLSCFFFTSGTWRW